MGHPKVVLIYDVHFLMLFSSLWTFSDLKNKHPWNAKFNPKISQSMIKVQIHFNHSVLWALQESWFCLREKSFFILYHNWKKSHYVVEPVIKGPRWYIATFQYFDTTHFFLDKLISFPTICHAVCKRRWVLYIKRKVLGEPCRCFWPFYQFLSSRHLLRRAFAYIEHCFSRLCYTEPP